MASGVPMDLGRDRRAMGLAAVSHSQGSRPPLDFELQTAMKGWRGDRDCLVNYKACRYIIPQTIRASCLSIHVRPRRIRHRTFGRSPTFSHGVSLGTSSRPSSMTLGKVDLWMLSAYIIIVVKQRPALGSFQHSIPHPHSPFTRQYSHNNAGRDRGLRVSTLTGQTRPRGRPKQCRDISAQERT
jgi:hypothetical protein